jgi:uncharacterized membrane protein YozB (DUF420 family)
VDLKTTMGFLGTGASLASDISLLAYIFLIVPAMITGFIFARRKLFVPHHKLTMTTITIVNWVIILYLMLASYSGATAIPDGTPGKPNTILPTIHLIPGALAQIMATILLIRMWFENTLPNALRFEPIKRYMRITLGLWLITALLGISTYITWYGIPFAPRAAAPAVGTPAATEEATAAPTEAPEATEEATESPEATEEATQSPEATEEATQTPEATTSN